MNMHFFMKMIPPTVTQQEHRIGKRKDGSTYMYEDAELKAARLKIRDHLARFAPEHPMAGPVRLMVKWCFPITGDHTEGEWKVTKPDTDNLQKMLKDEMTHCRFWSDDAQVCSEMIEKFYSELPGIFIWYEDMYQGEGE